jgi:plasmid maintenance system antidote protein VapI
MALRLQAWLGIENGGDAKLWLAEQTAYDLWQAGKGLKKELAKLKPALMPA